VRASDKTFDAVKFYFRRSAYSLPGNPKMSGPSSVIIPSFRPRRCDDATRNDRNQDWNGRRMTKIGTEQFSRSAEAPHHGNFRVERINPIVSHWQEPTQCTPGFGPARVGKCEIERKNIYEELVNMQTVR
jgi:hypothetical protein